MFPWMLLWNPYRTSPVRYPFSGDVIQWIAPETDFFSQEIDASAGNADVERRAFQRASYGRQLGWITDVLLDLADQAEPATPAGQEARQKLERLRGEIEALKHPAPDLNSLHEMVTRLAGPGGVSKDTILQAVQQALDKPADTAG